MFFSALRMDGNDRDPFTGTVWGVSSPSVQDP